MTAEFTLRGYQELVKALISRGYSPKQFDDADPRKSHLILRHDIDVSPERAVKMAVAESEIGVSAHYFVLIRSEIYNAFSSSNLAELHRIADLGHELGLHLDCTHYGDTVSELEKGAAMECELLERALGLPVQFISFHRPTLELQGMAERVAGRNLAYQPRYFQDMAYCSDSRGAWHHGHPLDHPGVEQLRAFQLVTHPVWWVAEAEEDAVTKFDRLADERGCLTRSEMGRNCEPYGKALEQRKG